MGRRAKNKQAAPIPLLGSDLAKRNKGKKKAPSTPSVRDQYKAVKGVEGRSSKDRQKRVERKGAKVDEVDDEDSDLDEALRPGALSEDEEETVKVKSMLKNSGKETLPDPVGERGPAKELVFSDSEGEDAEVRL